MRVIPTRYLYRNQLTSLEVGLFDRNTALEKLLVEWENMVDKRVLKLRRPSRGERGGAAHIEVTGSSHVQITRLWVVPALCFLMMFSRRLPKPWRGRSSWQRRVARCIDTLTDCRDFSLPTVPFRYLYRNQLTSLNVGLFDKNTALRDL